MFFGDSLFYLTISVALCTALPLDDGGCLDGCPEFSKDKINVHLIPHSHDDVGWLKTYNQYYYGGRTVGVDAILSSVLAALKQNSARRFIQVETAFFWKWWQKQSQSVHDDFKDLVKKGQIEIVNGGWVMNDEACTNYLSTIHQFTTGLRIIEDTVGVCGRPKVGWQIDPFGHSLHQAIIYEQLGFNGVIITRIDYQEKENRIEGQNLDFVWKTNSNSSGIFYNIMKNHYSAPRGFCFDILCEDDGINDDPDSFEYNADNKKNEFEYYLKQHAAATRTGNILVPMGDDFNFQSADRNFMNLDKLVAMFENHPKYNVFYSTPSCYIKAVNEKKMNLPVLKSGDFFPYADSEHSYWAGFYTSRPNSKRFERTGHNILQANKQLRAILKMLRPELSGLDTDAKLTSLGEAIATMQHHDAITGTEKQAVEFDYRLSILKGIKNAEQSIGTIIGSLLSKNGKKFEELKLSSCLLTNMSICANSVKDKFVVTVYNPLSTPVTHYVRLPVSKRAYDITGPDGPVEYDMVQSLYSTSKQEIVFAAADVPPMGLNLYYIAYNESKYDDEEYDQEDGIVLADTFGTGAVNFTLNKDNNQLESVSMNGITLPLNQAFYYYPSENGEGSGNVASGAYIFRPTEDTKAPTKASTDTGTIAYKFSGKLIDEVQINVSTEIKQIIRVYKGDGNNFIEFDWLVGPILGSTNKNGKEYVTRYGIADFNNNGYFYTDSNGKELIERIRSNNTIEPIASNFYPVTSKIAIRDQKKDIEVAVLNDRSQGGTSLNDGQIELMVHRRLYYDDGKGVAEALNEVEFGTGMLVRGRHQLIIGKTSDNNLSQQQRDLEWKNLLAPYVLVADATSDALSLANLGNKLSFQLNSFENVLPDSVQVITFERWDDKENTYLLRLENSLQPTKDSEEGDGEEVDLDGLFTDFKIKSKEEKTLGGVQGLNEAGKLEWFTTDGEHINAEQPVMEESGNTIYLKPGQIRTFVITLTRNV